MVVPVGYTNAHHLPTEFFTVYRPEGENTIMPCTWHETGISIWGVIGKWRYEVMGMPALNSLNFSKDQWIKKGSGSAFEFTPANNYAVAARVDNYSIPGMRIGVSGYYGHSFNNTLMADEGKYKNTKGAVAIGTIDFDYHGHNWIVRGNFDYGHLGDAEQISKFNFGQSNTSPYKKSYVGKAALCGGMEAGYDIFSQFSKLHDRGNKLYMFGRYEYYDSYIPVSALTDYTWTDKHRMALGLNYYPMKEIVIKAEYSKRFFKSEYNNEPSISLGIAYSGFFIK